MKRILITLITCVAFVAVSQAQERKNAIGLRLGDGDGFGTEISYQRYLNTENRLEFDLGWRNNRNFDAYRLTALYQWVWNIEGGFNWYVGAGGGVAQVDYDFDPRDFEGDDTETYVYAAGDIGIEYDFDFPLLLSLDFRPEIGFGNTRDDVDFDIALGVRYQF